MEMTHDKLLQRVKSKFINNEQGATECVTTEAMLRKSLISVVELHKPFGNAVIWCDQCSCLESEGEIVFYPCPTIQAIEKELP